MTEPVSVALDELIERITTWPSGMPVRAMERVLALGEAAVPAITGALARGQDDEAQDILWLIRSSGGAALATGHRAPHASALPH